MTQDEAIAQIKTLLPNRPFKVDHAKYIGVPGITEWTVITIWDTAGDRCPGNTLYFVSQASGIAEAFESLEAAIANKPNPFGVRLRKALQREAEPDLADDLDLDSILAEVLDD
jgi:hypothetical protein